MEILCPRCKASNAVTSEGTSRCTRCGAPLPSVTRASSPPDAQTPPPASEPSPPSPDSDEVPPPSVKPGDEAPPHSDEPGEDIESPRPLPPSEGLNLPAEKLQKVQELETAIHERPEARALYLQLDKLYVEGGRTDLAVKLLKRFLVYVDPKNVTFRSRLDILKRQLEGPPPSAPPGGAPAPSPGIGSEIIRVEPHPRTGSSGTVKVVAAVILLLVIGVVVKWWFFPATRRVVAGDYNPTRPQFSPDGDRIAFIAHLETGQRLCVFDHATESVEFLASVDWGLDDYAWSPSGTRIAYESYRSPEDDEEYEYGYGSDDEIWGPAVYVVGASGGKPQLVAMGSDPSWSPDGMSLVMVCTNPDADTYEELNRPCVVNVLTGGVTHLADLPATHLSFSPRGDRIVFQLEGNLEELLARFESEGGDITEMLEGALESGANTFGSARSGLGQEMEAQAYESGGADSLAAYFANGDIYVMAADGSDIHQLTSGSRATSPRWTHDGDRLLFTFVPDQKPELWSISALGGEPEPFLTEGPPIWNSDAVRIVPDGSEVVFPAVVEGVDAGLAQVFAGVSPVDVYVAKPGGEARRIDNRHSFKSDFDLAPDGRSIVYVVSDPDRGGSELWVTKL